MEGNNVNNKGVSLVRKCKEMPYKVAVDLACQGHHCKQDKGQILAKRDDMRIESTKHSWKKLLETDEGKWSGGKKRKPTEAPACSTKRNIMS